MRASDMADNSVQSPATGPARRPGWKSELYRHSRLWHGWLSAFAFLALIFFCATGLLLNHPDWFAAPRAAPVEKILVLSRQELTRIRTENGGLRALASYLSEITPVYGAFKDGFVEDDRAILRMESARGSTDLTVNLLSGKVDVALRRADTLALLNELHRGGASGPAWRGLIDVAAITILVLSVLGYVLFFSMKFRLKTSLLLTAASLAAMSWIFFAFVP